ncbi:hypothetical protein ACFT8W_14025 [Streptomyces hygroscopicus]|uniref:hypothetical protein n=1 Tax=Streptomyces hygroscopicus TaxID=1912 RepID=UPI003636B4C5
METIGTNLACAVSTVTPPIEFASTGAKIEQAYRSAWSSDVSLDSVGVHADSAQDIDIQRSGTPGG